MDTDQCAGYASTEKEPAYGHEHAVCHGHDEPARRRELACHATAHAANDDWNEARTHGDHAVRLAAEVGSTRQHRRLASFLAAVR